jgi:hypothetical protein
LARQITELGTDGYKWVLYQANLIMGTIGPITPFNWAGVYNKNSDFRISIFSPIQKYVFKILRIALFGLSEQNFEALRAKEHAFIL